MVLFTVTTASDENDGGTGGSGLSLREALTLANSSSGADTINFAQSLSGQTISLTLGELVITDSLTLTGLGANNLSLSGNSTGGNGGGISNDLSTTSVSNSNFSGNRATNNGGGISSNLSTTTVNNSNLSGNSATNNGGGIYSDLSTTTVSNSNLSGNSATNNGGGIASTNSSSTTLSNSSLTQNTAGNNGGGFSNSDSSFVRLNNNTLNDNSAGLNGGGLANESSATAIVSQNAFSHNMAANSGGGIYAENSDTRLSNSTVTLNWAASGNGTGLFKEVGTFTATSTIVANNESNLDIGGSAFSSGGNNLIGNGSGASGFTNGVNGDLVGTAAIPIDPLLGSLQNNGGPTLTHALLAGSPAINVGSNPDNLQNDQRGSGFPRTLDGATDIGAYEVQTINGSPDAVNDSATTSENTAVTINVLANDTDPDSDAVQLETFTQGANGTVTLNNNGTADKRDDTLTYTPNPNFNGHDSFTYSISDLAPFSISPIRQ
jgi:parallel beta-helix repeat protein/predicted outer membrane repeat protein